jgi:predicted phosphodiesterase
MPHVKPFPHPDLSMWQSAVDQVVAKSKNVSSTLDFGSRPAAVQRPDTSDSMVAAAVTVGSNLEKGVSVAQEAAGNQGPKATEGVGDWAKYCSSIWWEIAKAKARGDAQAEANWHAQLGPFSTCDERYAEAAEQYVKFFKVKEGKVPYKRWQNVGDFIVDYKVPQKARIAILGDWGTGQPEAKSLLAAIARKKPDVIFHLGDVYYSGTEFEVTNYFLNIWNQILGLPQSGIRTFSLSGNHDMYCGGGPYYQMIQSLGQPASYFCLRNDDWQFIALDTGLHDDDAFNSSPTYLEDTEVQWLKDKIDTAGNRKTVLLSHHQLFTAFEAIAKGWLNEKLNNQLAPFFPKVAVWFWGHEHNQVIYKRFQGVLGRCIGHGAYPVGITEIADKPKFSNVPLEPVTLTKGQSFYSHGYLIMDLDGPKAHVSYYQDSDPEDKAMWAEDL